MKDLKKNGETMTYMFTDNCLKNREKQQRYIAINKLCIYYK